MTKEEMKIGLLNGRILNQEEWAEKTEIQAVDELVSEGIAIATEWKYSGNFQCEYRKIVKKCDT